jgi:hypothetical protein
MHKTIQQVVAETIATYLLVFVTCGSAALSAADENRVSKLGASVAGGLIVTVMIYAVGHISGAHMNPAVTLAFAAVRHFPWKQVRNMISFSNPPWSKLESRPWRLPFLALLTVLLGSIHGQCAVSKLLFIYFLFFKKKKSFSFSFTNENLHVSRYYIYVPITLSCSLYGQDAETLFI